MKNKNNYLILVGIIALIVLAIYFLEKDNVSSSFDSKIQNFTLNPVKEQKYNHAIELAGATGYINADQNFNISSLIGNKVILVDFWTYSCINCVRTLPYLNSWYDKYKDQGLVIVGVHTPEFAFEKDYSNVKNAVDELKIKYPVLLDSNYNIWNAYSNQYWPAEYLIDSDGYVVETHFGEGDYDKTEENIRNLLEERAKKLEIKINLDEMASPEGEIPVDFKLVRSPETYFGANRNNYLANGIRGKLGVQNLTIPDKIEYNSLYLIGSWNITSEYASPLSEDSSIIYGYVSKNVYLVADALNDSQINVFVDNNQQQVDIGPYNLYPIVEGKDYGFHVMQISNFTKEMKIYTFTFG